MSYNDEIVLGKLSGLNETQDSIVGVAQWMIFHRRYADQTAQLFMTKLKSASGLKRIALIYLANEIVQQSKARKKDDFLIAFSPIIAEATAIAYKGSSQDVQEKIRRVVEVWRGRQIFDEAIQGAVEKRIEEIDKLRTHARQTIGGGSIFGSSQPSVPSELIPLVAPLSALSKSAASTKASVETARAEYDKQTDPSATIPSAPVYAARLNSLLKTLASAEGAVAERVKHRNTLIAGLQKLLASNDTALKEENAEVATLKERWHNIDTKKREVEDSIMRGFANSNPNTPTQNNGSPANATPNTPAPELDRPKVEELTPPPFEQITPVGSPKREASNGDSDFTMAGEPIKNEDAFMSNTPSTAYGSNEAQPGYGRNHTGTLKKRKLNSGDEFDFGDDENLSLDPETTRMLGNS